MTLLGLDFDNTLVRYDELFHKLAVEKGLVHESTPVDKVEIRQLIKRKGKEEEFTLMQGEVYGPRILEAPPAEGMLRALQTLKKKNMKMILVSHKTKTPYKGPAYNLRESAMSWLDKHGFFDQDGLGWTEENIFFEDSIDKKIDRIKYASCKYFVDDLPKVIELLPRTTLGIYYCPTSKEETSYCTMRNWSEAEGLIKKNEK